MPAVIKSTEVCWKDPVVVRFGFTGLSADQAIPIIRRILDDQWPAMRRPKQCVYVIRLRGEVAVAYGGKYSPVIYIGEGNAYWRLYNHAQWIADLLLSVPNLRLEVHVAEVSRRNHSTLYEHIEADLIAWFRKCYGCLPWFNRQSEKGCEDCYSYDAAARLEMNRKISIGSGNKFLWAIRPTPNNAQYDQYSCGVPA
jgi:hypothetical protein